MTDVYLICGCYIVPDAKGHTFHFCLRHKTDMAYRNFVLDTYLEELRQGNTTPLAVINVPPQKDSNGKGKRSQKPRHREVDRKS